MNKQEYTDLKNYYDKQLKKGNMTREEYERSIKRLNKQRVVSK